MKKVDFPDGDLYVSSQKYNELYSDCGFNNLNDKRFEGYLEGFWFDALERIFRSRNSFKEYIQIYGNLNGLDRIAVLSAHGCEKNGKWVYRENKRMHSVQSWIERFDGKYAACGLLVCSPGNFPLYSKKSLLLIPDRDLSIIDQSDDCLYTLSVPGIGELDSVSIGYQLSDLKEKVQSVDN
jgi:hypothetical protein